MIIETKKNEDGYFEKISRINSDGSTAWIIERENMEVFVSINLLTEDIKATTFSGMVYSINKDNGHISFLYEVK